MNKSKEIENKIIKHYGDNAKRLGAKIIPVDKYSIADLVVKRGDKYSCLEVKARRGNYNLDFFKKSGMSCETSKLDKLSKLYGVETLTLVTVTSDGYILKGVATKDTPTRKFMSRKTTDFSNRKKVEKEFFVISDFKIENKKITEME